VMLICGLALALWFLPAMGYERWFSLVEAQDRSSELRFEELKVFWLPYVLSHPMGSGVGTFSAVTGSTSAWEEIGRGFTTVWWRAVEYGPVHNGYLLVYAELGIVGVVSYIWLLWSVTCGCFRAIRIARSATLRSVSIGTFSAMLAFAVHDLAAPGIITFPMSLYFWAICGLGIAVSRIAAEAANRQNA
jgi:O-antigen ligase